MDISKDESSFASKMMNKMGWKRGKGLGKNEDGNPNIIRVSKKGNTKGMGFKGNDMDWVAHQNDFDGLLNELKGVHQREENPQPGLGMTSNGAVNKIVMNLEEKSKLSRSRVHYHRNVKGKDLSKANEQDLSSILGLKKSKKDLHESLYKDNINQSTSSTNMKDYFTKKMKGVKEKKSPPIKNEDNAPSDAVSAETNNLYDEPSSPGTNKTEFREKLGKRLKKDASTEIVSKHKRSKIEKSQVEDLDESSEEMISSQKPIQKPKHDETDNLFYKKLNYSNIVSHNLKSVNYRSLALKATTFCNNLQEIQDKNFYKGSNILHIKGYGNW